MSGEIMASVKAPANKVANYRQRGYECQICGITVMTFGSDEVGPCPKCPPVNVLVKKWDHLVTESIQVIDFIDPLDTKTI